MDQIKPYFNRMLQHFKTSHLPWLKNISKNKNTIILILAAEGSSDHFYVNWSKNEWTDLAEFYNGKMIEIFAADKTHKNVYFMNNNEKTAKGRNLQSLLPDGTHKIKKNSKQKIPPSLMADSDFIFNLLCNRKFAGELDGDVCCREP